MRPRTQTLDYGDPEPPQDTMWATPARRVIHYQNCGWAFLDEPEDPVAQWGAGHPSHFPMTRTSMEGVKFFRTPVTQIN